MLNKDHNPFKEGDKIRGNQNAEIYSITNPGWEGTVVGVESAEDITVDSNEGSGLPESLVVVDASCFDLIQRPINNKSSVKTKGMKNLAAAAKALKNSGPEEYYDVSLYITTKVLAHSEDEAIEITTDRFDQEIDLNIQYTQGFTDMKAKKA